MGGFPVVRGIAPRNPINIKSEPNLSPRKQSSHFDTEHVDTIVRNCVSAILWIVVTTSVNDYLVKNQFSAGIINMCRTLRKEDCVMVRCKYQIHLLSLLFVKCRNFTSNQFVMELI